MASVKDIKKYFDKRLSGLEKHLSNGSTKRKREKDFKYKSNETQFKFNEDIIDTLEDVIVLLNDGAINRPIKKLRYLIEDLSTRNKLIRIADKSLRGWQTVKEYQSDSVASDSADERKIREAERRAIAKSFNPHRPSQDRERWIRRGTAIGDTSEQGERENKNIIEPVKDFVSDRTKFTFDSNPG